MNKNSKIKKEQKRRKRTSCLKNDIWFYIKSYKFNSMFIKSFILVLCLFSIPFIVVSSVYYSNVKTAVYKEIEVKSTTLLYEMRDVIDSILSQCDSLCTYMANDSATQMYMLNDWYGKYNQDKTSEFSELFKTLPLIYDYIDSVYVYSLRDNVVLSDNKKSKIDDFKDNNWVDELPNSITKNGSIIARLKNNYYPQIISIIKPVYIENDRIGAIVLNIDTSALCKMIINNDNYNPRQQFFFISQTKEIILSTQQDYFKKYTNEIEELKNLDNIPKGSTVQCKINNENHILSNQNSDKFPFSYVNITPLNIYKEKLENMVKQIVFSIILLIILSFIVAYFIASNNYKPVMEIISVLERPENFTVYGTNTKGNINELKFIISNILKTIQANEEMKVELSQRLKMLDRSQFAMLQMQINPHFLYNTLDTINWMAVDLTGNENDVSKAIGNLAQLYRTNINTGDYLITLKDEMEQSKHYINILKLRYDDLFDVVWDIDSDALNCIVLKICMQPIIENAVYHGLKPKRKKGILTVRGCRGDGKVVIVIGDNGVGIEKEKVDEMNNNMRLKYFSDNEHIGLYNVNQRIKIIYGDDYGVFVSSDKDDGTRIRIIFPETYL